MRTLQLTYVQPDELRLKLRGTADAARLWVACDARTKIIPAFALGPRTPAIAHQRVHQVGQRLAAGCLPIFSSDGLALYFYALTAHFGEWVQTLGARHRVWRVAARLHYAQVVKRYRRRRETDWPISSKTRATLHQRLLDRCYNRTNLLRICSSDFLQRPISKEYIYSRPFFVGGSTVR